MVEVCEFHEQIMKEQNAAIEGRVAKASLKWVAAVFSIPTIGAILTAWAFIASADYRFGTNLQAQTNASNIKLLDERTINLKQEIIKLQGDIQADLGQIKVDIKEIARDLKIHSRQDAK